MDSELLTLCEGDAVLYGTVILLDKYDLGGTNSDQPGEYIVEARELLKFKNIAESPRQIEEQLTRLHKTQFSLVFRPIFRAKYKKLSQELYNFWQQSRG